MKIFSEETRRKMSESAKKRCADPAWIEAQKNRGTKLDLNAVKEMYERGMTQMEIAAELHTTQKIVFNFGCAWNNGDHFCGYGERKKQ